jgi:hypothetical protein
MLALDYQPEMRLTGLRETAASHALHEGIYLSPTQIPCGSGDNFNGKDCDAIPRSLDEAVSESQAQWPSTQRSAAGEG